MSSAKAFLARVRKCDAQIDNLTALKWRTRERAKGVTSRISRDGVLGSGTGDRIGRAAVEVADLEQEIDKAVCRYVRQMRKAVLLIDELNNPDHIKLLTMRYIEYKSFDQIAKEMNRSVQGIFYMHGRALEALEQILIKERKAQ